MIQVHLTRLLHISKHREAEHSAGKHLAIARHITENCVDDSLSRGIPVTRVRNPSRLNLPEPIRISSKLKVLTRKNVIVWAWVFLNARLRLKSPGHVHDIVRQFVCTHRRPPLGAEYRGTLNCKMVLYFLAT